MFFTASQIYPNLILVSKVGAYKSGTPAVLHCKGGAPRLACKYYAAVESTAFDKHSSLLGYIKYYSRENILTEASQSDAWH